MPLSVFDSLSLPALLALWVLELLAVGIFYMRSESRTVGLVLAYLVGLWLIHWMGAIAVYENPVPVSEEIRRFTVQGFALTTLGLNGLLIGMMLTFALTSTSTVPSQSGFEHERPAVMISTCLTLGTIAYAVSVTPLGQVPTLGNFLSELKWFVMAGLILMCWESLPRRNKRRVFTAVAIAMVVPAATVVSEGFLGYGIGAVTVLFTFLSVVYRPRWQVFSGGILALFLALSLFVTYMRDRVDLRASVWGGENYSSRIDRVANTLSNFELFDPSNPNHWDLILLRLNQNELVGRAYFYTPDVEPFEYGQTIWLSIEALVPRIVWPDKPQLGGSGDLVSRHTGVLFVEGVSVGVGQPLEFFINFGTTGVFLGFVLFGAALTWIDRKAGQVLVAGDYRHFLLWFMTGVALLQPGGSISEIAGAMIAGFLLGQIPIWVRRERERLRRANAMIVQTRAAVK